MSVPDLTTKGLMEASASMSRRVLTGLKVGGCDELSDRPAFSFHGETLCALTTSIASGKLFEANQIHEEETMAAKAKKASSTKASTAKKSAQKKPKNAGKAKKRG